MNWQYPPLRPSHCQRQDRPSAGFFQSARTGIERRARRHDVVNDKNGLARDAVPLTDDEGVGDVTLPLSIRKPSLRLRGAYPPQNASLTANPRLTPEFFAQSQRLIETPPPAPSAIQRNGNDQIGNRKRRQHRGHHPGERLRERTHAVVFKQVDEPPQLAFMNAEAARPVEHGRRGQAGPAAFRALQGRCFFKGQPAQVATMVFEKGCGGMKAGSAHGHRAEAHQRAFTQPTLIGDEDSEPSLERIPGNRPR